MYRIFTISLLLTLLQKPGSADAQTGYVDSLRAYQQHYADSHEVVLGDDRKNLRFYPVNPAFRVVATFERVRNGSWFTMETSGNKRQTYRVYGTLRFPINDTLVTLHLYQSQQLMAVPEYRDHLFLPFTDLTSGEETYASGRYIDFRFDDILGNSLVIDFNKAYNPYCAYVRDRYNCPIPPRENSLPVAILAGEKNYAGKTDH